MPTSWKDLSHEGKTLRYMNNRILKRFKKHNKEGNDVAMVRAANCYCSVVNTHRRIVDGIKYEKRLEEIETILQNIRPEAIAEAKMRIGI